MATHGITKEATDRFTQVDGVKIHYNDVGSGPALFTFHGGGPGANAWDNTKHNIDALAEHFRVLPMDMPGYGFSDKDAKLGDESLDRMWGRMVLGVMDNLGIEKAHLYGSSQSGPTCLRFGIEHPDRIGKIILQSSGVGGPLLFNPSPVEGIKSLGIFAANPVRSNMEYMMHLFIPKDELCTEDMIEDRFQAALIPGHLEGRLEFSASKNSDVTGDIRRLKAPVLVVWGHQDRMVPVEGAFKALAMIPDVRVHIWGGGTGHFVEYEHAEEFNRLVIDFLGH
jgi:pimeloyl-ACP methyl ester carboxylesterase